MTTVLHATDFSAAGVAKRVALGSVAERVVALAPCPVLTVRGR